MAAPLAVRRYASNSVRHVPRDPRARVVELFDPVADWPAHPRVPSAAHVARYLVARHLTDEAPTYRGPDGIVVRRDGDLVSIPPAELRARVEELLGNLPERVLGVATHGHSDLYRGLRTYLRLAPSADRAAYLDDIAAAVPAALDRLPTDRTRRERPAAKSAAERDAARRARRARRERETVAAFLADRDSWADDLDVDLIPRAELVERLADWVETAVEDFDAARDEYRAELAAHELALGRYDRVLARWRDDIKWHDARRDGPRPARPVKPAAPVDSWPEEAAENGYPPHPVAVGPRRALALFRELGVAEVRRADGRYHRLTDTSREDTETMHETAAAIRNRADAIREEADAKAYRNDEEERELDLYERRLDLLRRGDRVGALMLQRDTLAATGTEGRVIDATDRFRRRTA